MALRAAPPNQVHAPERHPSRRTDAVQHCATGIIYHPRFVVQTPFFHGDLMHSRKLHCGDGVGSLWEAATSDTSVPPGTLQMTFRAETPSGPSCSSLTSCRRPRHEARLNSAFLPANAQRGLRRMWCYVMVGGNPARHDLCALYVCVCALSVTEALNH